MVRKTRNKPKPKFEQVPKKFHTVTPYLAINGAVQAVIWYKDVFGARELEREQTPDGKVIHARLKIGDSSVMLSDIFPGSTVKNPLEPGRSPITLHVYSKNVDGLWKRAVEAGAKIDMQLGNMFWGERYGQFTDPFYHSWSLSMRIQMSPKEMAYKRQEAMKMFKQREHA
jgi:PhnB protein